MEVTGAPRRSSRPTTRPVKFWDFEKPDYSKPHDITYKITDLTNFFGKQKSVNGTIKKSFSNTTQSKEKSVDNKSNKRAPKKSVESDKKGSTQQVAPKDKPTTESTTNGQHIIGSSCNTPLSSRQKKRLVMAFQKKIKDHISLPSAPRNVKPSTTSVLNATDERRHGEIRMKPPELQNIEKIPVKETNNGETQIMHHKKAVDTREKQSTEIIKRKLDQAPQDDKSPPKRKKSSEKQPEEEEETLSQHASNSEEEERGSLSKDGHEQDNESEMRKDRKSLTGISVSNFRNLFFQRHQTKDCICYLAKGFHNSKMGFFTGFVFLEHGNLVWLTKMNIFIMVVGGRGRVKMVDIPTNDEIYLSLVNGTKFTVAPGMKAVIRKDARSKMLKMFVQLTSQSSSMEK